MKADLCVTVTVLDGLVLARSPFHHSMNYRSVVAFGRPQVTYIVFQQLRQANIWSSRALTLSVNIQFFQCIIMSVLYYGETWAVQQHISPLVVFQMNCLRCVCGIALRDHVPNHDMLNWYNTLSVECQLQGKCRSC